MKKNCTICVVRQILYPVLEIKSKNQEEKITIVVGHIKNVYRILVRNMNRRDHVGDKGRWKDDIKIDYKGRGFKGLE